MTIGAISETVVLWVAFNLFIVVLLALDLGLVNRKAHAVGYKEAAIWSAIWVGMALAFNALVWLAQGSIVATQFFTAYLIEKSLSVDNIFVFVLIFSAFAVPATYQHRVLFWGVLGALVLRGLLIIVGATLIAQLHWVLYLFGAFLILTGIRMALQREEREIHPQRNPLVRLARRVFPVTPGYEGARFFVRRAGQTWITPLLIVLLVVESSDLIFALDSIPAVLAISTDPFIVYTSNVFAILGLRSLYFLLAGSVASFACLKYGLAAVLVLVGVKMLIADIYHIPIAVSLALVALFLALSVAASLLWPKPEPATRTPSTHMESESEPLTPGPHVS